MSDEEKGLIERIQDANQRRKTKKYFKDQEKTKVELEQTASKLELLRKKESIRQNKEEIRRLEKLQWNNSTLGKLTNSLFKKKKR